MQFTTSPIKSIANESQIIGEGQTGFVRSVNAKSARVWDAIKERCVAQEATMYNLVGYSRGGDLVSIFALMILKDNLLPVEKLTMTTFGSPRALTEASAAFVNSQLFPKWRLVNRNDPVAEVPPVNVSASLAHPLAAM